MKNYNLKPVTGQQKSFYGKAQIIELDNAQYNFFNDVIVKSWTWERLTEEEKQRFYKIDFSRIKGTAKHRIEQVNLIYSAFLQGIGYQPIGWREPADTETPKF